MADVDGVVGAGDEEGAVCGSYGGDGEDGGGQGQGVGGEEGGIGGDGAVGDGGFAGQGGGLVGAVVGSRKNRGGVGEGEGEEGED